MKIIFCIFGCATKLHYKKQILKIKATWGKNATECHDEVLFFIGEEKTELQGNDIIYLDGVKNDYYSASDKQNLGLKYIHDNHYIYDFIFIAGTDTYVNIDILHNYLQNKNTNDNICIGGHGAIGVVNDKQIYYHSGGAGIIISKYSLDCIYPQLQTMFEKWKLLSMKPTFIPACDLCLCYYLHECHCTFITEDLLFYNCNYKSNECHQGIKMDVISCHTMTLEDFDIYTQLQDKKIEIKPTYSKMKLYFTFVFLFITGILLIKYKI